MEAMSLEVEQEIVQEPIQETIQEEAPKVERRPIVRPKDKMWEHLKRLAQEHGRTPLDVLKEMVWLGEEVVEIEEKGGEVFGFVGNKRIEIKAFSDKREDGQTAPTAG